MMKTQPIDNLYYIKSEKTENQSHSGPLKVCIIDDDKSYRAYLKIILEENKHLWLHNEYGSGSAFMRDINNPFKPDVCLVDVVLKDMSGLDCAREIKKLKPDVHIVIMTAYPDEKSFVEARKIGADYIEKGPRIEALLNGIIETKNNSNQERIISLQGKNQLKFEHLELAYEFDRAKQRIAELSTTQLRVVQLKRLGKSIKEIATTLDIDPGTVRTHYARAIKKLKLPDLLGYLFEE
ncbi:MAG: response regulator transcription factor [Spirochaetota bacterium]|nr:response regulator transcription factor [Spirochaetota bacterium]